MSLSARLSSQAIIHLIRETNAQAILTSPQLQGLVQETTSLWPRHHDRADGCPTVFQVPSYDEFLETRPEREIFCAPPVCNLLDENDRNVVILHSSGTTGMLASQRVRGSAVLTIMRSQAFPNPSFTLMRTCSITQHVIASAKLTSRTP